MTAAESAGVTIQQLTKFQLLVKTAVSTVVPSHRKALDGETDLVEDYTSHYNCCPPPLFMITISVVEVIFYSSTVRLVKAQILNKTSALTLAISIGLFLCTNMFVE